MSEKTYVKDVCLEYNVVWLKNLNSNNRRI